MAKRSPKKTSLLTEPVATPVSKAGIAPEAIPTPLQKQSAPAPAQLALKPKPAALPAVVAAPVLPKATSATAVLAPATLPAPNQKPVAAVVPKGVTVGFVFLDPNAQSVLLCGDFNAWSPGATPMKRSGVGDWQVIVHLAPGRYEYKFLVDGEWVPDPLSRENVWNRYGTLNSVIHVPGQVS